MLSFFRKIRQKLLSQNRVTRYLVYALGEIILVVIGILIALQVNNWNEERKTKAAEQKILKALLEEFESNSKILDEAIALNKRIAQSAIEIGKFTGPSILPVDERKLSKLMVGAFKFDPSFVPNQGVILETVNSGKLSILSNPELRKTITNWLSDLERVKNQEEFVKNRLGVAHNYFISSGNFRRHLEIITESLIQVEPSRFGPNEFKFLEDPSFESNLYLCIVASENLNQNIYPPLKERTEFIISLIKNDLNERL